MRCMVLGCASSLMHPIFTGAGHGLTSETDKARNTGILNNLGQPFRIAGQNVEHMAKAHQGGDTKSRKTVLKNHKRTISKLDYG